MQLVKCKAVSPKVIRSPGWTSVVRHKITASKLFLYSHNYCDQIVKQIELTLFFLR
jgi:hypothetical protein